MNGLTRAGGKQFASNAGRKPDRYTGSLMGWQTSLVREKRWASLNAKPGGTAEVITTLLSQ